VRKCGRNGRVWMRTRQSSKLRKLDEDYRDFINQSRFHRKRTTMRCDMKLF